MMTVDRIEDLAWRGVEMPKGLGAAEQMLFLSLRKLYATARLQGMDPDQGAREKREILREYRSASFQCRRMEHTDRMWKEIEQAANRFGRERTLENAEKFVEAVYGCRLKERNEVTHNGLET